jgi:hypothetical protein
METDLNLWGIFVVPVGVLLCFSPALLVWLKEELSNKPPPTERRRP